MGVIDLYIAYNEHVNLTVTEFQLFWNRESTALLFDPSYSVVTVATSNHDRPCTKYNCTTSEKEFN